VGPCQTKTELNTESDQNYALKDDSVNINQTKLEIVSLMHPLVILVNRYQFLQQKDQCCGILTYGKLETDTILQFLLIVKLYVPLLGGIGVPSLFKIKETLDKLLKVCGVNPEGRHCLVSIKIKVKAH